jgi:DinB superfamily
VAICVIPRPAPDEYAPYYGRYVERVPEGDLGQTLEAQLADTRSLVHAIPERRGITRYAPDKWSIKGVLGHVIDTERIMSYRALRVGRGDPTPLPGYEQNDYVPTGGFDERTLENLSDELASVRQATIHLLRHFDAAALVRRGTASGHPVTTRALAYIIAGHERHHVAVLRDKYLPLVSQDSQET